MLKADYNKVYSFDIESMCQTKRISPFFTIKLRTYLLVSTPVFKGEPYSGLGQSTEDGRSMSTFYYCSVNHQSSFQNNHILF